MVFVLDTEKRPLSPCHEARARKLLKNKKASIYRRKPFTIILHRVVDERVEPCKLKIDPGSRHTGLAIVRGQDVLWMGQIEHKTTIKDDLEKRAAYRRRRRSKNKRYRKCRFDNRRRPKGWFPPTVMSRLQNAETIAMRLMKICPIGSIAYELVHFDTQLLQNPDIKGIEYQQGPLFRTEMRTFLLDTYKGVCQYCGGASKDHILEWEHIIPKSRGGSNSLRNATLSCRSCNEAKGAMTAAEWKDSIQAKKKPSKLDNARLTGIEKVLADKKTAPLAAAAITNSIRWKLKEVLETATCLPVTASGSRWTKYNRVQQGLPKDHCIDAACVGRDLPELHFRINKCLVIEAKGRGKHCRTNVDANGFPRGILPRRKEFFGFQTGDLVRADIPSGMKKGLHVGRVACRSTGSFNIRTQAGRIQGINYKYIRMIQRSDGYGYYERPIQDQTKIKSALPPHG